MVDVGVGVNNGCRADSLKDQGDALHAKLRKARLCLDESKIKKIQHHLKATKRGLDRRSQAAH